jgi:hypothetical protein
MITADQILAHLVGDYLLQSDWMAQRKRTNAIAAMVHAFVYSLPFLFLRPSALAWYVIVVSHWAIDYLGLARYVVWAKNFLAPRWLTWETFAYGDRENGASHVAYIRHLPWRSCQKTGYPPDRPDFLAVWLLIIADNVLHLLINGAALRWL